MLSIASILIRACAEPSYGRVTASEPSFGVDAASTYAYVRPPSSDRLILTLAVEMGGRSVPATSHVTVWVELASYVTALACDVTRNGPVAGVRSSVVSAAFTPPLRSRAVKRKWSESGVAFVPAKPT